MFWICRKRKPQGADPLPLSLSQWCQVEIILLLPTGIGEWYSRTIYQFWTCSALAPMWTPPLDENAELSHGALLLILYSEPEARYRYLKRVRQQSLWKVRWRGGGRAQPWFPTRWRRRSSRSQSWRPPCSSGSGPRRSACGSPCTRQLWRTNIFFSWIAVVWIRIRIIGSVSFWPPEEYESRSVIIWTDPDPDPSIDNQKKECWGFGSGIQCIFGLWIPDPGWRFRILILRTWHQFLGSKYLNSSMRIRIRDIVIPWSWILDNITGSATLRKIKKNLDIHWGGLWHVAYRGSSLTWWVRAGRWAVRRHCPAWRRCCPSRRRTDCRRRSSPGYSVP